MTFSMQLDERALGQLMTAKLASTQIPVQTGMGEQLKDIVMSNFGETGVDRPAPWPPLSDRSEVGRAYIRKVGRSYATLHETGAMAGAVRQDNELTGSEVSLSDTDCKYATIHHTGSSLMPRRRVFPILDNGEITAFSKEAVLDAAKQVLQEQLK